jgi:threonine dehydrogenase-like Zn-dependent dehydrogenase
VKAIVYTGPLELQYLDVDEPEPADGEVVIDVRAVGICGSELEGFASKSPFRVPPLIMGHEFAGVRADTGEPVVVNPLVHCSRCDLCLRGQMNLCRNRAVVGIHRAGGFAERVAVPERNCYALADDVALANAALVEPMANAVHAFRLVQQSDPQPLRVGIIGGGMLGFATALQALARGVPHVMVTDLSDARLDIAGNAGVHAVGRELEGEFDAVFDAVGSAQTRRVAMEHLRPGGTCVWIGLHGPEAGFDGLDLIRLEKRVVGTFCYHDPDYRHAISFVRDLDTRWIRQLPLENGVDAFYGLLEETPDEIKTLLVTR